MLYALVADEVLPPMNFPERPSRRQCIERPLTTSGTLGLTTASGQIDTRKRSQIDPAAIQKFRARLRGGITLPTEAGYEAVRRVHLWNPDTERRPALIARCAHTDDIRYAVEFARKYGLELAVRGGGHSMLGGGTFNGLVIGLAGMTRVRIDTAKRICRIDAGVLGGEVVRAAGRYGLAPVLGEVPGSGGERSNARWRWEVRGFGMSRRRCLCCGTGGQRPEEKASGRIEITTTRTEEVDRRTIRGCGAIRLAPAEGEIQKWG